jgi:hypothetical protein
MRARRTLVKLWAIFLSAAVVYAIITMAVTGGGLSNFSLSFLRTNDAVDIGIALLATLNLVQFVLLSATMANSVRRRMCSDQKSIAFRALVTPWVTRWAVVHAVSVWGVLLALLRRDAWKYAPFFLVTVVGLAFSYPSSKGLGSLLQKCGIRSIALRSDVPSPSD